MREPDKLCYSMNNPYLTSARPLDDYRPKIMLEDGEHRVYDVKPIWTAASSCGFRTSIRLKQRASGVSGRPGGLDMSYDTLDLGVS